MTTKIAGIRANVLISIVGVSMFFVPGVSSADSLARALNGCAGIENDGDRLKCFDAVAAMADEGGPATERDVKEAAMDTDAVATIDDEATPASRPDVAEPVAADVVGAEASVSTDVAVAAGAAVAQSAPVPLTEDVGLERVKGAEREKPPEYAAVVTRCERHPQSALLYFYLENGQVWKQSSNRRLNYRDCQFEVTLTKDAFGYKLYVPSKDKKVRVTRIR